MAMANFLTEFKILSYLKDSNYNTHGIKYIVSLDEVGRGALAGPVVVGATLWQICNDDSQNFKWISNVKDSKKLSKARRQELFHKASENISHSLSSHVENLHSLEDKSSAGAVSLIPPKSFCAMPKEVFLEESLSQALGSLEVLYFSVKLSTQFEIDDINILNATCLAASRALKEIALSFPLSDKNTILLLDGKQAFRLEALFQNYLQVLITKGDNLLKTIGLSSILAKVFRDGIMEKLHGRDARFHFDRNVGYGTKEHCLVLQKGQSSSFHRRTFLKNFCV